MRKVTSGPELDLLSRDSGIEVVIPRVAYFASNEEEVLAAMGEAGSAGLPVTPRGGGTGIPTQSVGTGALIVQTGGIAAVSGDWVVCSPGVVKAELNTRLALLDRWVPVDPSSYASCTVGGMVANNSSGARTLKYGPTIGYVEEIRVALGGHRALPLRPISLDEGLAGDERTRRIASLIADNWSAIEGERPKVSKNSSGYRLERVLDHGMFDLPKLFVGSEGTLGITTEATFSTRRRPAWRVLFIVESSLDGLDRAAGAFRGLDPSALELVDKSVFRKVGKWDRVAKYSKSDAPYMIFCEMDGATGDGSEALERVAGSAAAGLEPTVVTAPGDIKEAWETRGETLTLAQEIRDGPRSLVPGVEDLVVPPERLGDLVALLADQFGKRGLDYIMYGHAGDANLHARPLLDLGERAGRTALDELMEDCFEAVWSMKGSMTGEHGDGRLRARYVERQYPRTYWIMREIKDLFDPHGMMNPGVKIA